MTKKILDRKAASEAGLQKYFTGEPCAKGHLSGRSTKTGECITCKLEWNSRYREQNKSAISESRKASYATNSDRERARKHRFYIQNRGKILARKAELRKERPDVYSGLDRRYRVKNIARITKYRQLSRHLDNACASKRRAAKQYAVPAWAGELDYFLISQAHHLCQLRMEATGIKWHVDHAIPLLCESACGLHCADNIQVIPAKLNLKKNNKLNLTKPHEWLGRI